MPDVLTATSRATHKWLGESVPDVLEHVERYILCARLNGTKPNAFKVLGIPGHYVSIENDKVTCQECLEWLHA